MWLKKCICTKGKQMKNRIRLIYGPVNFDFDSLISRKFRTKLPILIVVVTIDWAWFDLIKWFHDEAIKKIIITFWTIVVLALSMVYPD